MLGGGRCNRATPLELGSNPLAYRYDDVVVSSGVKMGTMWLSRVLVLLLYNKRERNNCDNNGGADNGGRPTATGVPAPTTNATVRMTIPRT